MYFQQISSPVSEIINGVPASWDPCTASAETTHTYGALHAVWSPCGRFVATSFGGDVQVHDSNTLERLSVLKSPLRNNPSSTGFLALSPDGRLLAHTCKIGTWLVVSHVSMSMLTSVSRYESVHVYVWDFQTGVAVADIRPREFGELIFSGNSRTATILEKNGTFCTYDAPNGTYMCEGKLAPSPDFLPGAHWIHEDTLRFATRFETDGMLVINILELQPTLDPPLLVVESFPVPPHNGKISFSPVSFHASFVSELEVVILDVRDSRILLQIEASHPPYTPPGHFSPNGCFFACGIEKDEIRLWKNASAGYVPWNSLRSRLSFKGFSFSPTTSSILAWGPDGVQLLEHGNHPTILSPNRLERQHQHRNHLVAYSADGTRIAMAQREKSVVTVLDSLPNILPRSFDTYMRILDIRIVGDVIFVADGHKLVSWHLETGEPVHDDETATIAASTPRPQLTLSNNCSQIAFADEKAFSTHGSQTIFLYDVQARRILCSHTTSGWHRIETIRFSPDGRQLWLAAFWFYDYEVDLVKLGVVDSGNLADVTRGTRSYNVLSWAGLFSSHARRSERVCEQTNSRRPLEWVVDSRGKKLLWLPLSWRVRRARDVRWDGDFLAFVGGDHPKPIIIKFQS